MMRDIQPKGHLVGIAWVACTIAIVPAPEAMAQTAQPGWKSGTIERTTSWRTGQPGVHLVLKAAQETIPVHLGPAWFIDQQDVQLKVGDRLVVTGSRVTFNGKPALVAASITRGDETLTLRDATGRPVWAGWRRQQR